MAHEWKDVILESALSPTGFSKVTLEPSCWFIRGKGYEVELTAFDGELAAIVTLPPSQLRPAHKAEIAHARNLAGSTP